MRLFHVSLITFILGSLPAAIAADLQVPGDHPTIQSAIDAAANGDRIIVAPGVYGHDISFDGKDVDLVSSTGPALTTIDLAGMTEFEMGPGGSLIGFTIKNGMAPNGGGLTVEREDSYIADNVFEDNWLEGPGRGASIFLLGASPVIERNVFRRGIDRGGASSGLAGMISMFSSIAPQIINNVFHDNAFAAINNGAPRPLPGMIVANNTMVRNQIGIRLNLRPGESGHIFRNNVIVGGEAGLEIRTEGTIGIWENNLVHGNTSNYRQVPDRGASDLDQTGTNGNISADPLFTDPANNDFTLQASSPAIDAGTNMSAPLLDLVGNSRPMDGDGDSVAVSDIGAYEAGVSEGIGLFIEGELQRECDTTGGALVMVSIKTVPEDLQINTLRISINGQDVAESSPAEILVPVGVNLIAVHALTEAGAVVEDSEFVNVTDTTPPELRAWFAIGKQRLEIETIQSRSLSKMVVRIEANDICDPDPEITSVLGTPIENGQAVTYKGKHGLLSVQTDKVTLSATARDSSGNTTSVTKELQIEIAPPYWNDFRNFSWPQRRPSFLR